MSQSLFYEQARDDETIWRYLPYSRYEQMVLGRYLFFSRIDNFEDQLEGTFPQRNVDDRNAYFRSVGVREEDLRPRPGSWGDRLSKVFRSTTYANCWRLDTTESDEAWTWYCPGASGVEGVAILTTAGALVRSITTQSSQVLLARVQYCDFRTEAVAQDNLYRLALTKDRRYEVEKEARAIMIDRYRSDAALTLPYLFTPVEGGVRVPVDLTVLLRHVYVRSGSTAPGTILDRVIKLHGQVGLRAIVSQSIYNDCAATHRPLVNHRRPEFRQVP